MAEAENDNSVRTVSDILVSPGAGGAACPVWLVREGELGEVEGLSGDQRAWLETVGFKGQAKKHALLPGENGTLAGVVFGLGGDKATGDPAGPAALLAGALPGILPGGTYRFAGHAPDVELASAAWALGSYTFNRYKAPKSEGAARLELSASVDERRVRAIAESVWMGRDLINTPAGDMGPDELEAAARSLASRFGAKVSSVVGDDLLKENFPLIHAVGRASVRAPRLVDLTWGRADAPKVTLVGKGICFDTGGLDIKPASGMLNMKKDMGGAATVLSLAFMIMSLGLDVRLRVLLAVAENSISGNAFRPKDIIRSRLGKTVEIGNTDAEGRLVLCDALALADEEAPDKLFVFATLTGAARVAFGPDVAPFYCDNDDFARDIVAAGGAVGDPVWRMPFWDGYDKNLDSDVADLNNIGDLGGAGSIIAALFLRRFVSKAKCFAHFDIYGWRNSNKPLGPKGGEPTAARAVLSALEANRS